MASATDLEMQGLVRIAVYGEHTTRAGQQVLGDYDPESDDISIYEGTRENLRAMAQRRTEMLTAAMQHQRKVGRTILRVLDVDA